MRVARCDSGFYENSAGDHKVGHYFKRVTMIDTMFGDADHHLRELARRGGSPAAA